MTLRSNDASPLDSLDFNLQLRRLRERLARAAVANPEIEPNAQTRSGGTPPTIAGLTVGVAPGIITAEWGVSSIPDLRYYELQYSLTPDFASATTLHTGSSRASFVGVAGTTYYVRVRVVNQAGNPGGWSNTEDSVPGSVDASMISVPELSAISADIGTITAGSLTLDADGFVRGGQAGYDSGIGFFIGYTGGAYKFSIGDPAGAHLKWDGTNLIISGAVIQGATTVPFYVTLSAGDHIRTVGPGGGSTSGSRTATPVGGTGPFTYAWIVSPAVQTPSTNHVGITGSATNALVAFFADVTSGETASAIITCTVTDTFDATTASATFTVTLSDNS